MATLVSYETNDDGSLAQYGNIRIAQTFKLLNNATLSGAQVKVLRTGSPGTVSVGLYTTDGAGKPDTLVRSIAFNGDNLTTDAAGEWQAITYTGGEDVDAGTYALVISGGVDVSNSVSWRYDASSPTYANGQRAHSTDAGSTWSLSSSEDFMFIVEGSYGFTPPLGKPTTKRLVACAASALWFEDV